MSQKARQDDRSGHTVTDAPVRNAIRAGKVCPFDQKGRGIRAGSSLWRESNRPLPDRLPKRAPLSWPRVEQGAIAGAKAGVSAAGKPESAGNQDEDIVPRVAPRPRPGRGAGLQRSGTINHSPRETLSQQGINVGAATHVLVDGQMRQYQLEIPVGPSPRIRDDKGNQANDALR